MASLVADYSSESESSCDSKSPESESEAKKGESTILPKPDFQTSSSDAHSVFVNPFVAADKAKIAILERHVKMISTDVKTVNGKKICWNYRKNKCRFGHNCKYAHDSDLQLDSTKSSSESSKQMAKLPQQVIQTQEQSKNINNSNKRCCVRDVVTNGKIMRTAGNTKLKSRNLPNDYVVK